jgi:hypothetical protein
VTVLRFVNVRRPKSADELSSLEREQLFLVGKHFDGKPRAVELRFTDQPISEDDEDEGIDWDDGNLGAHMLSVWDVHDDAGRHLYDVWLHHADNGCVFEHGTTMVLAGRYQSTWLTPDGMKASPLAAALDAAMHVANTF